MTKWLVPNEVMESAFAPVGGYGRYPARSVRPVYQAGLDIGQASFEVSAPA